MYNKIKTSLFTPSKIIEFINDKWTFIWLYFFMLVLILLIPNVIVHTTSKGFNPYQYQNLDYFVKNELRVKGQIENYELNIESGYHGRFERFDFIVTNDNLQMDLSSAHMIIMSKYSMKYVFNQIEVSSKTYQELGLESYDFKDKTTANQRELIAVIDEFYEMNKSSIIPFIIAEEAIVIAIDILIFIVIISVFNFKPIPFKFKFKINLYAATIYVLLSLFATLTQIGLLSYIGIILMFIYSNRAFRRVISIR